MPSSVLHVSVDCADPYALCRFWSQVTGKPIPDTGSPGDDEVAIELEGGIDLLFLRVPEGTCYEDVTGQVLRTRISVGRAPIARLTPVQDVTDAA